MSARRQRVGLGILLAGLLLLGLGWMRSAPVLETPVTSEVVAPVVPVARAPRPRRVAPPVEAAVPSVREHGAAVAHARIAEAMGLVAIRCYVGSAFDSDDLVGSFHQQIEDGWYSNVVTSLEGRQGVEERSPREGWSPGDPAWEKFDFEILFYVHWEATAPGTSVPCTVEPVRYADLTVAVVDPEGLPIVGTSVHGCGGFGRTNADGEAVFQVHAGSRCEIRGMGGSRMGRVVLEPLAEQEHRRLVLELEKTRAQEWFSEPDADAASLYVPPETEAGYQREIDVLEGLLGTAEGSEAALIRGRIRHRERMMGLVYAQEQRRADFDVLTEGMESEELSVEQGLQGLRDLIGW